jgi:hypothetical protein
VDRLAPGSLTYLRGEPVTVLVAYGGYVHYIPGHHSCTACPARLFAEELNCDDEPV